MNQSTVLILFMSYIALMLGWVLLRRTSVKDKSDGDAIFAEMARDSVPFSLPYLLFYLSASLETKQIMYETLGIFAVLAYGLALAGAAYVIIVVLVKLQVVSPQHLKGKSISSNRVAPLLVPLLGFGLTLIIFLVVRWLGII